ncbi:MAG: ribosome biogenesis GTPase Der [Gammaproteobacteria bacterium]|jgi:GTP-binding protein|nr:ribosome biogenesis GTPase Der [Gammaproteobacteria bacterium]
MNPVIALVGRPNVGKSTLFNVLTRSRDALVADFPGLTRDRKYGTGRIGGREYLVVDTGGLVGGDESLDALMAEQTEIALREADAIVLLVDAREGLTGTDQTVARSLRRHGKPVFLAANKTDGLDPEQAGAEFHALGISPLFFIAAAHGRGVRSMIQRVLDELPDAVEQGPAPGESEGGIRVAFLGRPNVGKSTLINRLLGEVRLLTFDRPGTTRDSIAVPLERDGEHYTLIDTAGVRRRGRVTEAIEKFSVVKSLQAAESANVVVMVLDARQGIAEQDATLLGLVLEMGRALVIAINKWDGLDADTRRQIRSEIDRRLSFLDFARVLEISALYGSGVGAVLPAVRSAYRSASRRASASELTRLLERAVAAHQPPLVRGRRIKLRYAHQGGSNPPTIVIHGNQTDRLPGAYRRYLMNHFRKGLQVSGTPVRLEFRTGENPYAGRRNKLTPRQQRKRVRMLRHVKKRG